MHNTIRKTAPWLFSALLALQAGPASALQWQQPSSTAEAPTTTTADELARGGRGGGGRSGGGGGSRSRGGGGGGSRSRGGSSGFRGASSSGLGRGSNRPSGGWSGNSQRHGNRDSINLDRRGGDGGRRTGTRGDDRQRNGSGSNRNRSNRDFSNRDRNNRDRNSWDRNNRDRRDNDRWRHDARRWDNDRWNRNYRHNHWDRQVNINNVNLWGGGWARPGWGYARPWNVGWYGGWSSPPWGWWGVNAAAWGLGTLATAAIIDSAVDNAINSERTYIVVPDSSYQLQYATIQPINNSDVDIEFIVTDQDRSYQMTADCRDGELNGNAPTSGAEAQLLNAACQVAFGEAS